MLEQIYQIQADQLVKGKFWKDYSSVGPAASVLEAPETMDGKIFTALAAAPTGVVNQFKYQVTYP